jgi:ATP-dependent Clp protease ATP-binding subunit ClpA
VVVTEPSVLDTIQILRGIAEKYASFHGVRISDRALVAAAELSTRYIQGRFCKHRHLTPCKDAETSAHPKYCSALKPDQRLTSPGV